MIGIDAIAGLVETVVNKVFPDANIEAQSKADSIKAELTQELQTVLGQLEINKVEASHSSPWVAGWRPYLGWVGGTGIAYEVILRPIVNGVLMVFGISPVFPGVDTSLLTSLVGGMLGLGIARSWDKSNGVDTKLIKPIFKK